MKNISASDFLDTSKLTPVQIIDVRNPDEFAFGHLAGSLNIPLDQFEKRICEIRRDSPIYVVCQNGLRSQAACQQLELLGDVIQVEGGLASLEKAGAKFIRTSHTLPLMRQVLATAGALILLGFVLSTFIHPAFIYVSVFVGCGLLFAGLTGFCGLAILLAKMPWNNTARSTPSQDKGSCCS